MVLITLFGSILLLLYGMNLLNDGLRNAAGSRIRSLLGSLTSNRLTAVGTGALITGLIQSSSATSVMLVGFVSAGLMGFRQTLAVILGADIGATLTVQLIAFHIYDYSLFLIGTGLFLVFFRKSMFYRNLGNAILGFGFVFLSLKLIIEVMSPLRGNELFHQIFAALSGTPVAAILLSAVLTALIHTSAATIGIAIALAESGLISLEAGIALVLGANIGTCATALMASLRSPAEARRVAWAHVLFKVTGVILFLPVLAPFQTLVASTASDLPRQIANAHTLFNVIIAVLFLPFIGLFWKLVVALVPEKPEEKKFGPMYLDEHVLDTPALALGQATRETLRASDIVREMLAESVTVFRSDEAETITGVKDKDNLIDLLDRYIRLYITRLSASQLTEPQTRRAMTVLEISRDLESIGDVIDRNIMPLAQKRIKKGITFSQSGQEEIIAFHKRILQNFDIAISAFTNNDRDLADQVLRNKEELGTLERELVQAHLDRLRRGYRESIETSHIHLDLIGNLARINSLITHIIYPILEEKREKGRAEVGIEA